YSEYSPIRNVKVSSVDVKSIAIDKNKSIDVNQSITLNAVISPSNATNKTIIWSSSNDSVATVKNGNVTGISVGEVTIKAKAHNGVSASCKVSVGIEKTKTFDEFASAVSELIKDNKTQNGETIAASNEYYAKRLIVKGDGTALDFSKLNAIAVVKGIDNVYLVQFASSSDTKKAMGEISNWKNVIYVEPDSHEGSDGADMTTTSNSWGVSKIGADKYAERVASATTESVKVAVIDTGVSNHTFLGNRLTSDGHDFVDNDSVPTDLHGHGTHVSGTVVDCTPGLNVKIMPVRVLDANGNGYNSEVGMGIRYAADHGAKVINLSLGGGHSNYVDENINYAINKSVTVVVAAGNDYGDIDSLSVCPAHIDNVICVGAVDSNDVRASFSNSGRSLDVVAPGVGIVSCLPGGRFDSWDGTSMATPHIAALAAMLKLMNPSYSPAQVEQTLKENCRDLGVSGWDKYYGYGIPNFSMLGGVDVEEITLDKTSISLEVGRTETLIPTILPKDATDRTIVWDSDDAKVATVKDGVVTGESAGKATITATTSNGKKATCEVTVTELEIEPTGIGLDTTAVTINVNQKYALTAEVLPDNATNKTILWSSGDASVAIVSEGVITGKSIGTTTITAMTTNGKEAVCIVWVQPAEVDVKEVYFDRPDLDNVMYEGTTEKIRVFVMPSDATDKSLTWSSSDNRIATVDSNGIVSYNAAGKVTITAKSNNGKKASCAIEVLEMREWYVGTLGYKSNGKYYELCDIKNADYLSVDKDRDLYIKVPIDGEIAHGSKIEVAIIDADASNGVYDTSSRVFAPEGYSIVNWYPISWATSSKTGKVKIYYKIILPNGQIMKYGNWGSDNCFNINLIE
ncbi:MAG: Ig-like domain-containing protein, partial [Lachnospiraceae bacterium]|nr:Ig-like domain-containing protein [Lachnospiraceae bacterium]